MAATIGVNAASCPRAWLPDPGANLALDDMESLQSTYTADIVSDENSGTKPNFVITVDAALAEEPDDTVVENRTA